MKIIRDIDDRKFEMNLFFASVTCTLLDDAKVRYEVYSVNKEYKGEIIAFPYECSPKTAAERLIYGI